MLEQSHLEFDFSFSCKPSEKGMWKYQRLNLDTAVGVFKNENEHLEFRLCQRPVKPNFLLLYCHGHTPFEAKPTIEN